MVELALEKHFAHMQERRLTVRVFEHLPSKSFWKDKYIEVELDIWRRCPIKRIILRSKRKWKVANPKRIEVPNSSTVCLILIHILNNHTPVA